MSNIRFSDALNREPLRPVLTGNIIALNGTGVTNAVNVSGERGILQLVSFRLMGTTLTGSPAGHLTIQIDGGTAMTLTIWDNNIDADNDVAGFVPVNANNDFSTAGAGFDLPLHLPYNTSCLVSFTISVAASSATNAGLSTIRAVPV